MAVDEHLPQAVGGAVAGGPLTPASVRRSGQGPGALEDSGPPPDGGIQAMVMLRTYARAEAGPTGDPERARAADGPDGSGAERAARS
ncbi:hypothetical protein [Nocardiopsis alborubida]|uniref:Uncharacterized protein n=1 Tax=Nocardiopsis alborubida TaxID=146802 RepID=A0A7X6RQD6_9ACTN|nr:hypothetical protein [Nocardiopsis alborubida]NKY98679.1 hypothetical protein [Nocardiopsis alborubida]